MFIERKTEASGDMTAVPWIARAGCFDWGQCLKTWSLHYLESESPENLRVSVHSSNSPFIDYTNKQSFGYKVMTFKEFLQLVIWNVVKLVSLEEV